MGVGLDLYHLNRFCGRFGTNLKSLCVGPHLVLGYLLRVYLKEIFFSEIAKIAKLAKLAKLARVDEITKVA